MKVQPASRRLAAVLVCLLVGGHASAVTEMRITTELREVSTASVNGRELLTVRIRGHVGPVGCRGSVLAVDRYGPETDENTPQRDLETVALSAMLHERPVMLTIPLDVEECVDGKPTIADIHLLPDAPE